jgi:activating signal cointegrator 1
MSHFEDDRKGATKVKVLSIIQPWATLLALDEKKFETRSWATKHRGPLAIHSSKKIDKEACRAEPIRSVLEKHGYTEKNLPVGVIIATCQLSNCFQVTDDFGHFAFLENGQTVKDNEYLFGDFSEDRFGWEITDVEILEKFIPAKGQLGLWNFHYETQREER